MTIKMKACIYARTSSEDLGNTDKVSTEVQVAKCRELAEREGMTVVKVCVDKDRSGKLWPEVAARSCDEKASAETREGFTEAVRMLEKNKADCLLVYDTTRIARPASRMFSAWVLNLMERWTVITVTSGRIDTGQLPTDLLEGINHKILRAEIDKNTAKSKASRQAKADSGLLNGLPPYGWRSAGRGKIELVPEEVEVVRLAFKWWVKEGCGYYAIIRRLVELGVKSRQGKKWSFGSIYRLLRYPAYAGLYRTADGRLLKSPIYEVVVDEETWREAQAIKRETTMRNPRREYKTEWFLQSLMTCASCGSMLRLMTTQNGFNKDGSRKLKYLYGCLAPACVDKARINVEDMHKITDAVLAKFDATNDWYVYSKKVSKETLDRAEELDREIQRLQADRYAAEAAAGTIGVESAMRMVKSVQAKMEAATAERDAVQSAIRTSYPKDADKRARWQWLVESTTVQKNVGMMIHLRPMRPLGLDYVIDIPCDKGATVNSLRQWTGPQAMDNIETVCSYMLKVDSGLAAIVKGGGIGIPDIIPTKIEPEIVAPNRMKTVTADMIREEVERRRLGGHGRRPAKER